MQLTENRFEGGASPISDVAQAQTQLDTATAQETDIDVERTQYEHAIAGYDAAVASYRQTMDASVLLIKALGAAGTSRTCRAWLHCVRAEGNLVELQSGGIFASIAEG